MARRPISDFVDENRLWQRHMKLAQFGALPGGGVNRQALSREEIAARALIVGWARAIGLVPFTDAAANLFLRLEGCNPALPPVLIGSHIDSQPTGGKFDGAFGVLAALEVAEAYHAARMVPERAIEIVAWMNEEGSRFAPGMMGSAAYTGARSLQDIVKIKDRSGTSVGQALETLLAQDAEVALRPFGRPAACYLEAHIEQGPILEIEGKVIGIVTGIQGKRTFRVTVDGEENHAGTSPRNARRDALVSATAIITALQSEMWDDEDVTRFTIGMLNVTPNAPSVVPSNVEFSIDLRHPDARTLSQLGDGIAGICESARGRCTVSVAELLHDPPLTFPDSIQSILCQSTIRIGAFGMPLSSGAGHDARYLHYFCPTGMIFIPCRDGISHNEAESAEPAHLAKGAKVMTEAVTVLVASTMQ